MDYVLAVEGEHDFIKRSFDLSDAVHSLHAPDPDPGGGDAMISHKLFTDEGNTRARVTQSQGLREFFVVVGDKGAQ